MSPRDPLNDLLDRWQSPAVPPGIEAEIRREIARCETQQRETWLTRLELAFARPSFAMMFVAACVLLGLFLAEARVSRLHAENGALIARSYVRLIDPLVDAGLRSRSTSSIR